MKNNTLNSIVNSILCCFLIACDDSSQRIETTPTNNIEAQYRLAQEYLNNKNDVDNALQLLNQLAEQGYTPAQNKLGFIYSQGILVQKDPVIAFKWYEKAAISGFSISQFNLAEIYHFGYGTEKDDQLALYWYEKSALQGYPNAMLRMAEWYQNAAGTEHDLIRAYAWYQLVKENGINVPGSFISNITQHLTDEQLVEANKLMLDIKWKINVKK